MKKLTLFFVLLSISFIGTCGSLMGDNGVKGLPPQGLYDSCDLSSATSTAECRSHLDKMVRAGFRIVLPYGGLEGDKGSIISYADYASNLGMKIIWDMTDSSWWATSSRQHVIDSVNLVKNHPATWGYYIADEPCSRPAQEDQPCDDSNYDGGNLLTDFSALVRNTDPNHPRLLVQSYDSNDPTVSLRPYVNDSDVIALDVYTFAACDGQNVRGVGNSSTAGQELADANNKQWAIVLQAFDAGPYIDDGGLPQDSCRGWPGRQYLLSARNAALTNGRPAFILWYSYFDIMRPSGDPAGRWADLVAAAFSPEPRTRVLSIATTLPFDPPPSDHDYQKALDRAYDLVYQVGVRGDGISLMWSDLEPSLGVFNLDETRRMLNYLMNSAASICRC